MTNGINTRELILQILLEIAPFSITSWTSTDLRSFFRLMKRENTVILQFVMRFPNISFCRNRRELLSPEYVRELWNIVF